MVVEQGLSRLDTQAAVAHGKEAVMGKRLLKLPRRLFGYQPASVDQLVADRDSMLTVAEQRVRSAEARIAELEEELSRREEDLEAVKANPAADRGRAESHPAVDEAAEPDDVAAVDDPAEIVDAEAVDEEADPNDAADLAPTPPFPIDEDADDAGDVEEWPLPTIRPRTVEFIPPPEPSADFDPMPIGNEDHAWTTPPTAPWEVPAEVPAASEQPWSGASEGSDSWGTGTESDEQPWPAAEPTEEPWSVAELSKPPSYEHVETSAEEAETPSEESVAPDEFAPHAPEEFAAADDFAAPSDDFPAGPEDSPAPTEYPAEHQTEEPVTLPQITPAFMSEELANVVKAAEESATKIIERAWESTRTQISQVDRLWREVQAEIIRFAAWRQHVDPMIETMQKFIEEARARIEDVPPRIQEALSPAVEAMARVDEGMGEFAKASDLPELLGKLHAEVAQAIETDDFTGSTSETEDFTGSTSESAPEEETESTQDAPPPRAHANGDAGSHERVDVDMARAIAHELRIINESGEIIPAPDNT
jgi:hypothetical protein